MEGFLFKKGRGGSIFGRHNWKQRWFILEQGVLNYYDSLDVKTHTPGALKGTVDVKHAIVQDVEHSERPNVFQITPLEGKVILLHSETEEDKNIWLEAIKFSIEQHKIDLIKIEAACKIFGFVQIKDVTLETLDNAYQEIRIKYIPRTHSKDGKKRSNSTDKSPKDTSSGMDSIDMEHTQRAYKKLRAAIHQRMRDFNCYAVPYECNILRAGAGIDFGISVNEIDGEIKVTDVMTSVIKITSISEESKGVILKGDTIVGVGNEVVIGWSLQRLNQRLTIVPLETSINFTFQRYFPKTLLKQTFEDIKQVEEFYSVENTVGKFSTRRVGGQKKGGSDKVEGELDVTTKLGDIKLKKSGEIQEALI